MKAWTFKIKSSQEDISDKLESKLKIIGGFVFNVNREKHKSVTFKIRKKILYPWYMAFQNWTVVKGELLKGDKENVTNVEITFHQHFFIRLIILTHTILLLAFIIALTARTNANFPMYILGGLLLGFGILLWISILRKFKKDAYKYRSLISEIFKIQ